MKIKLTLIAVLYLLIFCLLAGCQEPEKVGQVEIANVEYVLEHDPEKVTVSLDVRGRVKNTGPYDVKKVVVTGRCTSGSEVMIASNWFVTQVDKKPNQFDTISYIVAGEEESFEFQGIAYFFKSFPKQEPGVYPEGLEVYVESFETVQN